MVRLVDVIIVWWPNNCSGFPKNSASLSLPFICIVNHCQWGKGRLPMSVKENCYKSLVKKFSVVWALRTQKDINYWVSTETCCKISLQWLFLQLKCYSNATKTKLAKSIKLLTMFKRVHNLIDILLTYLTPVTLQSGGGAPIKVSAADHQNRLLLVFIFPFRYKNLECTFWQCDPINKFESVQIWISSSLN